MFYESNIRYLQTTYISDVFAWLELSVTSSLSYNFVECYAWECYVSSGFSLHSLFALMMAANRFVILVFLRSQLSSRECPLATFQNQSEHLHYILNWNILPRSCLWTLTYLSHLIFHPHISLSWIWSAVHSLIYGCICLQLKILFLQ